MEATSGDPADANAAAASAVFKSLVTRWQLRPASGSKTDEPSQSTDIHLTIKYEFVNPLYAAVSATVSDKVAGLMIEAFEKQARDQLGNPRRS